MQQCIATYEHNSGRHGDTKAKDRSRSHNGLEAEGERGHENGGGGGEAGGEKWMGKLEDRWRTCEETDERARNGDGDDD